MTTESTPIPSFAKDWGNLAYPRLGARAVSASDVFFAPKEEMLNAVKAIYAPFTDEEISARIAQMISPEDTPWHGTVEVIYQTIPDLHNALGAEYGDW